MYVNEEMHVYFLTCKTKVAPMKAIESNTTLTIPRLECCFAVSSVTTTFAYDTVILSYDLSDSRLNQFIDRSFMARGLLEHFQKFYYEPSRKDSYFCP